jgi:hypothetical protein
MRSLPAGTAPIALLLAATTGVPAQAGPGAPAISAVTCGEIADAAPDYQAALVYYAAGYREGRNFGLAEADRVAATEADESAPASANRSETPIPAAPSSSERGVSATAAASSSAAEHTYAGSPQIVGGLTLQAQEIIAACGAAPDVLLTDIISNHGGATGFQGSPSAGGVPATAGTGPPASSSASPSGGGAPAGSSALSNSGADAVSSDLNAASGQLQQNLQSAPPVGATATPSPGATPAPGTGATTP